MRGEKIREEFGDEMRRGVNQVAECERRVGGREEREREKSFRLLVMSRPGGPSSNSRNGGGYYMPGNAST